MTPTAPLTTAAEKQLHLILRDVCGVRTMDVIETLKPFLTTYAARVQRDAISACAGICSDIKEDAERLATKWHERRHDGARNMEAHYIYQSTGAFNCERAIRALPPGSPSSQTDTGDSNE